MELDVYIPELNLGIEYDGRHYHSDPIRDYEKNRRCAQAGIKIIRFREIDCPSLVGVKTIDIDSNDYNSLANGITQLISSINKNYRMKLEVDINLKRDFQTILEKKYTSRKHKSLQELYPDVAAMLSPTTAVKASVIPAHSNLPFDWICPDCGYGWNAVVTSVVHSYKTFNRTGCPRCAGKVFEKGVNDAATMCPKAVQYWDKGKNGDELSDYIYSSLELKWWKCAECKKSFERKIYVMCRKNASYCCEPCSKYVSQRNRLKKLAKSGNNLLEQYPAIAKYWDYSKNKDRPEDILPNSEFTRSWICSNCHESYDAIVAVKTRAGGSTVCYACSRKLGALKNRKNALQGGKNSFEAKYPDLAKEWHPTKNLPLLPSEITGEYNQPVWWYCNVCKQDWQRQVMVRTRGDAGCPICSGRVYCKGVNDLATKYPDIAKEWHPTLNGDLKPEDVRYHDDRIVYWRCKCGYEWACSVRSRADNGKPLCRNCKHRASAAAKRVNKQ